MNIDRLQKSADRMIRGAGTGSKAYLVRDGIRRKVFAARMEWKPSERGLFLDGSERFFLSALKLSVHPDHELDEFEFKGARAKTTRRYKIITPPTGPRPNGTVVYFDCACMFLSEA